MIVFGEGKDKLLKCNVCAEQKVSSVWATDRSSNFQRNNIERHCRSVDHQNAESKLSARSSTRSQSQTCQNVRETETDVQTPCVSADDEKLFNTVFCVSNEELPNDKVNVLLELQNRNGLDIKYKNLSSGTITEIQSCISTIMKRELVSETI